MTRKLKSVKRYIESKPLLPNRGLELAYARKLVGICKPMIREVREKTLEFYRENKKNYSFDRAVATDELMDDLMVFLAMLGDKYNSVFDAIALSAAEEMVAKQVDYAVRTFGKRVKSAVIPEKAINLVGSSFPYSRELESGVAEKMATSVANELKKGKIGESLSPNFGQIGGNGSTIGIGAIPAPVIPPDIEKAVGASIVENVSLIKSIPQQYLDRIAGAVTRSMQPGGTFEDLKKEIKRYGQMTERRAYNIAIDQSGKVYNAITLHQMKQTGIKKFRWQHTAGTVRQREWHLHKYPNGLNGGVFSLDDPPIIDPHYGTRGFPGQLPYCRCCMLAVIEVDGVTY